MNKFTVYDKAICIISLVLYILDVGTDIGLIVYFFINGYEVWGALTLVVVAMAALLMQVFSFHWHITDKTMTWKILLIHLLFLAPLHRYISVLKLGNKSRKTGDSDDLEAAYKEISDISILRLFETFLEAAPQLVLQLYIIFTDTTQFGVLIGLSTCSSLLSVAWSLTAYSDSLHLAYKKAYKRTSLTVLSQTLWQIGMVTSRVFAVVLFATIFHSIVLVPLGIHLVLMIVWITMIKPDFGDTACERHLFTLVAAIIHTFFFLNLRDGPSRWRMLIYYLIMLVENSLLVLIWFVYKHNDAPPWLVPMGFSVVFGGFLLGVLLMLLYYGCCHPSGPAPIPARKPSFRKPPAFVDQSLKTKLPLFDESVRSARINLWLSASLDLSKEGLCENPTEDYPGYTSLQTSSSDHGNTGDHSYSQMIRTPADIHQSGKLMVGSRASPGDKPLQPLYLETLCHSPRSAMNRTVYKPDYSDGNQVRLDTSQLLSGNSSVVNDRDTSQYRLNSRQSENYDNGETNDSRSNQNRPMADRFEQNQSYSSATSQRLDSSNSVRDNINLVEMFARCKTDPSYISNSSMSESVFHISPVYCSGRENSARGAILSSVGNHPNSEDILGARRSHDPANDRTPVRLQDLEFSPKDISPLDPYKLWEESQNRMGRLFYQPSPDNYASDKTSDSGMITLLPEESERPSHLSLSYTGLGNSQLDSSSHESLRANKSLNFCPGSVFYTKGQNVSYGSIHQNGTPLNKSDEMSFSNMSLPLPDLSEDQNRTQNSWSQGQGHTSGSSTSGYCGYMSDKKTPHRLQERNRSLSSYQEDTSPSVIHSSYSSDKGLSMSDRALTSGSDTYERSQRSFTSSGFQSEESNLSSSSPTYANQDHMKSQFHGAALLENEIVSIRMADMNKSEIFPRSAYDEEDKDIYSHSEQPIHTVLAATEDHAATNVYVHTPPSHSPSEIDVLALPPLLSRRSSSAGSAGSGRFFKDPTLSDENGNGSSEESQYPPSTDSSWRRSQFHEKSSLSAMISDMSSSKCGDIHSSDESLSIRSDKNLSSLNENRNDLVVNESENQSYLTNYKEHIGGFSQLLSDNKSESATTVYENINHFQPRNTNISSHSPEQNLHPLSPEALSKQSSKEIHIHKDRPLNKMPKSRKARTSQAEEYKGKDSSKCMEDYDDSPQTLGRSVDLFSRERWRASLDKEMRERLVSDLEKLAPRKLYQLQSKNARKTIPPVEVTEYEESPYKFRKPKKENCRQRNSGVVLSQKFGNDNDTEYENIKTVNAKNDYENVSPNYLNETHDYENLFDSKELLCPVARPESLADSVSSGRYSVDAFPGSVSSAVSSPLYADRVRAELYVESLLDSIHSRSDELSRTKSPINTSGINSAFKPVKSKSSETLTSKSYNNKTFTVLDTSSTENNSLSNIKELSKSNLERSSNESKSVNKSKRSSNMSQHSYTGENNNSTFPWSGAEESSSFTRSSNSFNYLNMVGYPFNFSASNAIGDDTSKQITHSYSDSIPWEDSMNKSLSFQNNSNMGPPRSSARQPLKALENTPVFSPIYGQDTRQSIEASARTRFMSTPKLSPGEVSLLRHSSDSGSLLHSRYKSANQSSGVLDKTNGENTSTWSTQGSYGEHSSLSATTYI